jgi:hypothetical protein
MRGLGATLIAVTAGLLIAVAATWFVLVAAPRLDPLLAIVSVGAVIALSVWLGMRLNDWAIDRSWH